MSELLKLNLGAGATKTEGFKNVDAHEVKGLTDIVHNLEQFPWPFENDSVDEIISNNLFEHLPNLVRTMEEIHRILKPNGLLKIAVPYYKHILAFTDPTHVRFFTKNTMDYFTYEGHYSKYNYFSKARFRIVHLACNRDYKFPLWHIQRYLGIKFAKIWQLEWLMIKEPYFPGVYEIIEEKKGVKYKIY